MNVDGTGYSYTNTTVMVTLVDYTTVIASFRGGEFYLIMFNETAPSTMSNDITPINKAWVRFIDLTESIPFVNVELNSNNLWSYVGFLEATPFAEIDTSSSITFQAIQTGTTNTYPISMDFNLETGNVCTIFLFATMTGPQGIVNLDRSIESQSVDPSASDSLSSSSTSDMSSIPLTTGMDTSSHSKDPHSNFAAKSQIFGFGLCSTMIIVSFLFTL